MSINTMRGFKSTPEPNFKVGDRIRLNEKYVEKVMNNDKVFMLYNQIGTPRDWIVKLCTQTPMGVSSVELDHENNYVLELISDPAHAVWQQEWFELVSHDNFEQEDDLFAI